MVSHVICPLNNYSFSSMWIDHVSSKNNYLEDNVDSILFGLGKSTLFVDIPLIYRGEAIGGCEYGASCVALNSV